MQGGFDPCLPTVGQGGSKVRTPYLPIVAKDSVDRRYFGSCGAGTKGVQLSK